MVLLCQTPFHKILVLSYLILYLFAYFHKRAGISLFFISGQAHLKKREFDKAINAFSSMIERNPSFSDAYYFRGYAYEQTGNLEQAITDYTEAVKINPDDPWPYYNRGKIYNSKGDYNKAIADFSQTLKLDPDFASAYTNRGLAYANMGDHETAIAEYSRAINLDSNCAAAYNYRGNANKEKGLYDSAISDYTKALELDPDAKELSPNIAVVYKNRGDAYKASGNTQKAEEDYETARATKEERVISDWIPTTDAGLADLAQKWRLALVDNPAKRTAFGWDADRCTEIVALCDRYISAHNAYLASNLTGHSILKKVKQAALIKGMRDFDCTSIRCNEKMNETDRVMWWKVDQGDKLDGE
jgi:Flp pilus assembly protein TadD